MARSYLHLKNNHRTFSGKAKIWISEDNGATAWTLLSESAELTITPETSEAEAVNNAGRGRFDDVVKNYIIEGKFIERGQDVRKMWSADSDQGIRNKYFSVWIQGSSLDTTANAEVFEEWTFYTGQFKKNHGPYGIGTSEAMFTFTIYCEANETCAAVTVTAPTADACFEGVATTTASIAAGEFHFTSDVSAT